MMINQAKQNTTILYKNDKYGHVFTIFVVLMLVFSVYRIPNATSVTIGEFIMAIIMIGLVMKYKRIKILNNYFFISFAVYGIAISFIVALFNGLDLSEPLFRVIRDSYYWVVICVFGYSFLNYDTFIDVLKKVCILLSILIILQEIVYIATGFLIPGFFQGALLTSEETGSVIYQRTLNYAHFAGYLKANGFLSEAAHCAQALLFASVAIFSYESNHGNNKNMLRLIALFSVASIFTFSVSGLIYVIFTWGYIVVAFIKSGKLRKRWGGAFVLIVLLATIVLFSLIFSKSEFMSPIIERILSASSRTTADNSSFLRVYKGLTFWAMLPIEYKFIGIGFGNYSEFISKYTDLAGPQFLSEYMNSFSYILVSSGIIGLTLLVLFFLTLYKHANQGGRALVIGLLLMSFSASVYSSVYWIWFLLGIIYSREERLIR